MPHLKIFGAEIKDFPAMDGIAQFPVDTSTSYGIL